MHPRQEVLSMKRFHVGDVLSVLTGRIHGPNGIGGVYEILNHMTGQSLFTHQLPRAAEACRPFLAATFPGLPVHGFYADIDAAAKLYGEFHEVPALPVGLYEPADPLAELSGMVGQARVIPVVTE